VLFPEIGSWMRPEGAQWPRSYVVRAAVARPFALRRAADMFTLATTRAGGSVLFPIGMCPFMRLQIYRGPIADAACCNRRPPPTAGSGLAGDDIGVAT
jgi:hypothetical protein